MDYRTFSLKISLSSKFQFSNKIMVMIMTTKYSILAKCLCSFCTACMPCDFRKQAPCPSWFVMFVLLPTSVLQWEWRLFSSSIWNLQWLMENPIFYKMLSCLTFPIIIKTSIILSWNPCLSFTISTTENKRTIPFTGRRSTIGRQISHSLD